MSAYFYILFNRKNGTLYAGATTDLIRRVYEHKQKSVAGFTKKYGIDKLGYYEIFDDLESAFFREKQIKAGNRKRKIDLIVSMNPQWIDLYDTLFEQH